MKLRAQSDSAWARLSEFIAGAMGLHFPRERWSDLQYGLAGAAKEFGFDDVMVCADWLLSVPLTKTQLQVLASHLTIGETYFFRESKTFEVFEKSVLPALIHSRRGREQRLRLWSAACCSGEEAYSLAILLRQLLPDLAGWQVTILATDINPHFLRKAVAGAYGEWSFRDTPPGLKERYFNRSADGRFVVSPEIKQMVTFEYLNLVEDVYPALATNTNAMDVIFCRNALMYFTPAQISNAVGKLHNALLDGGWLAVSPCETSQDLFAGFVTQNYPGVILYQKNELQVRANQKSPTASIDETAKLVTPEGELDWAPLETAGTPEPSEPADSPSPVMAPLPTAHGLALSYYVQGRYAEAADTLLELGAQDRLEPRTFSLLVRTLANQGRLSEAFMWCARWIAADKVDSAAHYLCAVVLTEQGVPEEARRSLQRALYLQPDFVLAHFALGSLARNGAHMDEAARHFCNAMNLLARIPPNDLLPESDGLTAGRLAETIAALTSRAMTR